MLTPSQQCLIPPFDRFRFTGAFVLATGFGWFLVWLMLRSAHPVLLVAPGNRGLWGVFVVGLVSGLIVSAAQWLVLRRYISDWLWILAGATGYVLLTLTLEAWWSWVEQTIAVPEVAALAQRFSVDAIVLSETLRVLLAALCAVWLGIAQWLFLRQHTGASGWWISVPSLAVLLSSSFAALTLLLRSVGINLPLETGVLAAGTLGTTQAIALCALHKQRTNLDGRDSTSTLVIAPEILDYSLVQTLAQQLQRRLNLAWTSEHLNDESLTYLVGVTPSGAIAAYTPTNTPAVEQLNQIPLPELVAADLSRRNGIEPLARFEVVFLPSGSLRVVAWRGVPLVWVAISMVIVVLALSAIAAYVMQFGK